MYFHIIVMGGIAGKGRRLPINESPERFKRCSVPIIRPCRTAWAITEDSRKVPLRHSNTNTLRPNKLDTLFHRHHYSSGVVAHRRSEEAVGAGILVHRSLAGGRRSRPVEDNLLDMIAEAVGGSIPPDQAEAPEVDSIVVAGRRCSNPCST